MANQFVETSTKGYFSRILDAVKGVVVGLILFVGSFGLIYWNEGSVDISEIAATAAPVSVQSVDASADGKLVYASGIVVSTEKVGDEMYLKPGDYLSVTRAPEMYAWIEKSEDKSTKNMGGSETTTTTYTYTQGWVSFVVPSSSFKDPVGHENPVMTVEGIRNIADTAKIGAYDLDVPKMTLPEGEELILKQEDLLKGKFDAGYVFEGKGTMATPQLGDMRISYSVVKNNLNGTVFGKLEGSKIVTYVDQPTNESLFRLFAGTHDEAIKQMHGEYTFMIWIFRLVGFLMMWIGLAALFGPLSVLLDIVPFFGSLSSGIIGIATFLVALVLSAVTILVAMILHSLVAMIVAVVVVVLAVIIILKMKGKRPTIIRV